MTRNTERLHKIACPVLDEGIRRQIAHYVDVLCRDNVKARLMGSDGHYFPVPDRGEAVRQAVMGCQVPTVILLTGKGAETRQKRGIEYIDCPSDVDYAKEYLHEYDVQHGMDGMSKVRALLDVLPPRKL